LNGGREGRCCGTDGYTAGGVRKRGGTRGLPGPETVYWGEKRSVPKKGIFLWRWRKESWGRGIGNSGK